MIESIISWLANAGVIAIIVASADAKRGYHIEKHPLLGFTLVIIIPTFLEAITQTLYGKAFLWWVLGL